MKTVNQNKKKAKSRTRNWKTVCVPIHLYESLSKKALQERKPIWRVIEESISVYSTFQKPRERQKVADNLERVVWYVFKLVKSLGAFHENPSETNKNYLLERLDEIKERVL